VLLLPGDRGLKSIEEDDVMVWLSDYVYRTIYYLDIAYTSFPPYGFQACQVDLLNEYESHTYSVTRLKIGLTLND
jgi:hypothetical protein